MSPIEPQGPASAQKSPTYPQRVHLAERPRWQSLLRGWEERVAAARLGMAERPSASRRDINERLLAQMLGSIDQLADAVRRLPMEVGHLYEEDHHRADEAVAALERLLRRWEDAKA